MKIVAEMWSQLQSSLFPHLRECLDDPPTAKLKQFVSVLEVVRVEEQPICRGWQRMGRRRADRKAIARAFIAKAVYDFPTTELLIEMLRLQPNLRRVCGWERRNEIPSPATFSRAFAEFARCGLGDKVHLALVKAHIGDRVVMHVCRDSTEIDARERPAKKLPKERKPGGKPGRPKRGETREPAMTRLQRQATQTADEAIAELPAVCDIGVKLGSNGRPRYWVGWKAHIDSADGGVPISVLTTSASLHDSQTAIPLAKRTAERVTAFYEIMDSAYDADAIHEVSRVLGHKAIIDRHGRRKTGVPFDPATAVRYQQRSISERVNARLKDEFGGRHLRVRGHSKAHLHIMFGIIALFADQMLQLVT